MNNVLTIILSLPKSLYWSVKLYKWGGWKCPILIRYNTEMHIKGKIVPPPIHQPIVRSKIGFGGSLGINSSKNILSIAKGCQLEFNGHFILSEGCVCRIEKGGRIIFGNNFYANKNCMFSADKEINIGDDVLLGWNVNIRDADGHHVFSEGKEHESTKRVVIGNHCWLASYSTIMKGVNLSNDCIVAYGSMVIKGVEKPKCLIGGYPARVLREDVDWRM